MLIIARSVERRAMASSRPAWVPIGRINAGQRVQARIVAFLRSAFSNRQVRRAWVFLLPGGGLKRLDAEAGELADRVPPVCCFQGQAAFRPWYPDSAGMADDASFQPRVVSISGFALLSHRPLE
jgi:hypothetical protein